MTGPGTNTYLVGIDEIVVIDPGPDDAEHLDAIAGCGGDRIRWIVCTHTHIDHFPGVAGLKERTGAEVLAFDARDGLEIDRPLGDGDRIEATEFVLRAVHTPGPRVEPPLLPARAGAHAVLRRPHHGGLDRRHPAARRRHGRRTSQQLERLKALRPRLRSIAPGHGHLIEQPAAKIDEYLAAPRHARAADRSTCCSAGPHHGRRHRRAALPRPRRRARARWPQGTVWAHLIKLKARGQGQGHEAATGPLARAA